MSVKTCCRCAIEKPAAEMHRDPRNTDGLSSFCKKCHQAASVAWQKANPEKVNATRRARYARQRATINSARRASYNYATMRWSRLASLYGVSREWYEDKMVEQDGSCAICKRSHTDFRRALSVDHDHKCCEKTPTCGKCNRGLLCSGCNTSLHSVERDSSWMRNAANYMETTK